MHKKLLRCFVLAVSLFAVSGCGIIDMIYLPPAEDTAQEIFEAANDAMSEKNYVRAVSCTTNCATHIRSALIPLTLNFRWATPIFWMRNTSWPPKPAAISESLHPRHEAIPYVLYQTGMSLMKQFRSIDRLPRNCRRLTTTLTASVRCIPIRPTPRARKSTCIPAANSWPNTNCTLQTCSGT